MFQFLIVRLLRVLATLFSVALLMFLLMQAIPGSPWNSSTGGARALANVGVDATIRRLDREFGLDLPLWRQFVRYLVGDWSAERGFVCGVVCGNLGPSIKNRGRTVQAVLFAPPEDRGAWQSRFGYSVRLVALGALIAVGGGVPLGVVSAARAHTPLGRGISFGLAALASIPSFVLGLLAIMTLASWLRLIRVLPDWDQPGSWLVPAAVLAALPLAGMARVTRAAVLDILHADYIRAARARGLSERRVLVRHVLRTALVPIVAYLGPTLVEMFTGLLIVENLYAFPGFGSEYWRAVLALDYPMIMALTLMYAAGIVLANSGVEMLAEALDPRLRAVRRVEAR